jgi:hypothetical protein
MTTTDASYCEQLSMGQAQRRLRQLYNVPLTRFTPNNPYTSNKYTKLQLDMRRKAEILKYSPNKVSSQTNSLTKKEKFSLLVKGNVPSPSQQILNKKIVDCAVAEDRLIPIPTSSCDVPGPVIYLYNDQTVPLYNYSVFNTRSYPDYVPTNLDPWQFVVLSNTVIYTNQRQNVYYLIISNLIDQPRYTYSITTPIGLIIAGNVPPSYVYPSDFSGNIVISLQSVSLGIYYNDKLVQIVSPSSVDNYSMTVNIPFNTGSTSKSFSATQFVGNLNFNKFQLYTSPSYAYTFALNVTVNITPSNTGLISYIGASANITSDANVSQGCSVLSHTGSVNAGASISSN